MITVINSENRLVQKMFANHLHDVHGWESIYAHNEETLGPAGLLGRAREREGILREKLWHGAGGRAEGFGLKVYPGKNEGPPEDSSSPSPNG